MFKSKSALSFNEFINKINELKEFGNNYGQWVVIDEDKNTITILPIETTKKKNEEEKEKEKEKEQKKTFLPTILEVHDEFQDEEEQQQFIVMKDPWSLLINLDVDIEKNVAYKRKRTTSLNEIVVHKEDEDEDEEVDFLKRIKTDDRKDAVMSFTLLSFFIISYYLVVIVF